MTSNRRNTIYLVILWVLICLNHFSYAQIVVRPSNTEALVGTSTFFNCSTSSLTEEIHWFYYAVGSTTDRTFVYGYDQFYPPFQDRFQIEKYGGLGNAYNLIITSVAVQDAGRYECQENLGRGDKILGELIVIGANPACTSNTETNEVIGPNSCGLTPTNLVLTCTVNYTGNEAPIMEIGPTGGSSIAGERVSRQVYDNHVTYKLTLKGDASLDGVSYKCQTRRSATTPYYCSYGPFTVLDNTSSESSVVAISILSVLLAITICGLVTVVIYFLRFSRKGLPTKRKKNLSVEQDDVELKQLKNKSSEELISSHVLQEKMKELEKRLYPTENIKYEKEPRLVYTITPKTKEKPISGIAILGNELFITSSQSFDIEVYDSATFVFGRTLNIGGLQDPQDITACSRNNCLYIAGRANNHTPETQNRLENTTKSDDQLNFESEGTREQTIEGKPSSEEGSNKLFKPETQSNKTPLRKPESKPDTGIQRTIENQEKSGPEIEDKSDIETSRLPQAQDKSVTETTPVSKSKTKDQQKRTQASKSKSQISQTKPDEPEIEPGPRTQFIPKNEDKYDPEILVDPESQPLMQTKNKPPTETISGGKEKPEAKNEEKFLSQAKPPTKLNPIPEPHVAPTTKILKIDSRGTILNSWPMEGEHVRLSTYESNVIVCLSDKQVINEYTADGILLITVRLSPAMGLIHPWQALKLTSMHFLICHGDKGDKLRQVCVVNLDGNIVKFCKEWKNEDSIFSWKESFEVPICIAEDSEKSIIVTDRDNSRVLLFNSVLRFRKELIPKKCLKGSPIRLCLNDTVGLLYVATNNGSCKTGWKNGSVSIFRVK